MTKKKKRVRLGKKIRAATGLPLPLAMLAARWLYRFDTYNLLRDPRFAGLVTVRPLCGDGCCGQEYALNGKRGKYIFY